MKGKRKFCAYLLAMTLVGILTALGKLDGQVGVNGLVWLFGAYMGGNVGEHFAKQRKGNHD